MTTPARILIVDDEENFAKSTAHILEEEGYICRCASNTDEGLAALALEEFDLVLADIRMPGNSDLEFFHQLCDQYPDVPLIPITGYPSLDTAVRCIRLKVSDYLVKPFEVDALKECIKTCLAERCGTVPNGWRPASHGNNDWGAQP